MEDPIIITKFDIGDLVRYEYDKRNYKIVAINVFKYIEGVFPNEFLAFDVTYHIESTNKNGKHIHCHEVYDYTLSLI